MCLWRKMRKLTMDQVMLTVFLCKWEIWFFKRISTCNTKYVNTRSSNFNNPMPCSVYLLPLQFSSYRMQIRWYENTHSHGSSKLRQWLIKVLSLNTKRPYIMDLLLWPLKRKIETPQMKSYRSPHQLLPTRKLFRAFS